jgi:peptide/nickel transport system permease protein
MTAASDLLSTGPEHLPPRHSRGYWRQVWSRLVAGRAARLGLFLVGAMVALALAAPLLCSKFPLLWVSPDGAISSPWLREFFAPFEPGERGLTVAFNYLLLFVPVTVLIRLLTERRATLRRGLIGGLAGTLVVLFVLPYTPAGPATGLQPKLDPHNYRALQRDTEAWGVFALQPVSPLETGFAHRTPPAWSTQGTEDRTHVRHLLGTDRSGRDVLARLIHGTRISLAVGIVAMSIATLIGLFLGALAGYFGGIADMAISRLIELMMCFPVFFLLLALLAALSDRSIVLTMVLIGATSWTGIARLVRGEVLRQRTLDYVTAATALGATDARVIFRHVLPNSIAPVLVSVTFGIAGAILTESGLAFLGLGVDPTTTPSWGELLYQAREAPLLHWWLAIFPGLAIFLVVTTYNLVGEALRDAMDPRLAGRTG